MEIEIIDGIFIRKSETEKAKSGIWFIHAFGESGSCYKEVFKSTLLNNYNLYVPDLPGFGVSPFNSKYKSIKDYSFLLNNIIRNQRTKNDSLIIVGHSASGLIGTWLCELLYDMNVACINVEGNLTEADNYFTGKALKYDDANDFFKDFSDEVYQLSLKEERFRGYYANILSSDPEGINNGRKILHQFCEK